MTAARMARRKWPWPTLMPPGVDLRVLRSAGHRGKGFALRSGMAASQGRYVMFADSGLTTPYDNALRGLDLISSGRCELAHGSRRLPDSVVRIPQHRDRKISSALFRLVLRLVLPIPKELTDTQCGFKVYRGDVARMVSEKCIADGFMFDVEMILRARATASGSANFPSNGAATETAGSPSRRSSWPILQEIFSVRRALASPERP